MSQILITGGTGLVGSHLAKLLTKAGHTVSLLSRSSGRQEYKTFLWDPEKNVFPAEALDKTEVIVHLAGAGIADKRWTNKYRKIIISSRVDTANLIFENLKNKKHNVHSFVSASGIGYYGENGDAWIDELRPPADDFLGNTCKSWEKAAMQFETLGLRVAMLRTGIVLANESGALPPLKKSVNLFAGAPMGSGHQYMSWIHIDDLCRQYQFVIENKQTHGPYNAVAPGPVENAFFMKSLARILHKPLWPINIPSFVLRSILGEKAIVVLEGQRVTNEKIRLMGFSFKYVDVGEALSDLVSRKSRVVSNES
jgi:uncharacterized protein (TIGR01777 family)